MIFRYVVVRSLALKSCWAVAVSDPDVEVEESRAARLFLRRWFLVCSLVLPSEGQALVSSEIELECRLLLRALRLVVCAKVGPGLLRRPLFSVCGYPRLVRLFQLLGMYLPPEVRGDKERRHNAACGMALVSFEECVDRWYFSVSSTSLNLLSESRCKRL
jgi:hypothetical protein